MVVCSLRITADISHWVVVSERLLDESQEDQEILEKVVPHVSRFCFCLSGRRKFSCLGSRFIMFTLGSARPRVLSALIRRTQSIPPSGNSSRGSGPKSSSTAPLAATTTKLHLPQNTGMHFRSLLSLGQRYRRRFKTF